MSDRVCGSWMWPGGNSVKIRADGVAEWSSDRGVWKRVPGLAEKYEVVWPGKATDFLKLSKDSQTLEGYTETLKERKRTPFEAKRKPADPEDADKVVPRKDESAGEQRVEGDRGGDPIVGRWRWMTGYDVVFKDDGTSIWRDGTRKGTWRKIPGKGAKYELTWYAPSGTSIDSMTLSPDGKQMKGYRNDKARSQNSATRL